MINLYPLMKAVADFIDAELDQPQALCNIELLRPACEHEDRNMTSVAFALSLQAYAELLSSVFGVEESHKRIDDMRFSAEVISLEQEYGADDEQ